MRTIQAIRVFAVVLTGVVLIGCESPSRSDESEGSWPEKMQGLSKEVKELLPFVYSKQEYYSPKNREHILEKLDQFSNKAHKIPSSMGKKFLGDDPLIQYSLERMSDDIERAQSAFQVGQVEYSRGVVKTVMNHCFRCHSMTTVGAEARWEVSNFKGLNLDPLEKADLQVATRKYEDALDTLESSLGNREYVQNKPFEYEASLRRYIALIVRIKKDPKRGMEMLDKVLEIDAVPFYIHEQVRVWNNSLRRWKKESDPNAKDHLKRGHALMKEARSLQKFAKDHGGDVEFLRATEALHESLKSENTPAKQAQVYYLLGETYEVLDELGYWSLHEVYYENCIRKSPRTRLAKQCFGRLQASVYLGYSGSSGIHIPASEKKRLSNLKELVQ